MTIKPRRSALYMPASNERAIAKARDIDCDVVILDLEDAVAPDAKQAARANAVAAARARGFGRRELVIRVNGSDTPWGAEDLAEAAAATPDAILVPKVSHPSDLARCRAAIDTSLPLWAMIETCDAFLNLPGLAAASNEYGVTAWVIGTNDLAKEMRCRLGDGRAAIAGLLSLAVVAARSRGIAILDGVYNELDDDEGLRDECRQGESFGFDGKTLIHPRQVPIANRAFAPNADEIRWAKTVVDSFALPENDGKGAIRVEGRMVERLHLAGAERVLAIGALLGED